MRTINIKKNNNGYAILFTIVVVSIISMISMGLANTALKQMILSGVARDSTTAFYEADLGSECALYGDYNSSTIFPQNVGASSNWTCAGHSLVIVKVSDSFYTIDPDATLSTSNDKCFSATILKTMPGSYIETEVNIYGYNICNKTNLRTVQRALKITY